MEYEDDTPIIKYDSVYTPNPVACPKEQYPSFEEMMKNCSKRLQSAEQIADAAKVEFTKYTCKYVLKPEFRNEENAEAE